MKHLQLLLISLPFWLVACKMDTSTTQSGATQTSDTSGANMVRPATHERLAAPPPCDTTGEILTGNEIWVKEELRWVRILANSETQDEQLGPSHRYLEVRNETCQVLLTKVLEVDQSPDYPYTFVKINYNNVNGWLAILGFSQFYLLHIHDLKLLGPYKPVFLNERYAEDASSGRINKLEVWEDYLIGQANDLGSFVFKLAKEGAKSVLPLAEYSTDDGFEYTSLFALQSSKDPEQYQLLIPKYDANSASLIVNPLLNQPTKLKININPAHRNNRFLVLKAIDENGHSVPIAIDMQKQQLINLPDEVARLRDTEIIRWMRSNT